VSIIAVSQANVLEKLDKIRDSKAALPDIPILLLF
jgi:hypothetical protein